jgi:subtilisin family serine protease/flagellar hook assembly protein FlgD
VTTLVTALVTALSTALSTATVAAADPLPTATVAAADPLPTATDPLLTTTPPTASPPGATPPTAPSSVLIVHVAGERHVLPAAIAQARTAGVTIRHRFGDAFSVRVPAADAPAAAARLEALAGVTSVELGVVRHFDGVPTDDPKLARQASYLDAVHAPAAWAQQHGSSTIKIAVVDSGVDVGHPDLSHKIAGAYNAVDGSDNVTDRVGHGTFVAGVAAADTNNGLGVAGAGYDTDILAVKIAGPDGSIAVDDEVAGIRWAANHGANIINLSLGGPQSSAAEAAAIAYAQRKGVLVVAAAGNDGETLEQYPAAYPGVVAVGATNTARDARAGFSNHGSWVTLAAPGVNIFSTVPRAGSQFWPKASYPNGYAAGDGTSFSTPLVAGEAALLKAQNPRQSAARLRRELVASAHGYANSDLGAGQVDFVRGLAHVVPPTRPATVRAVGTSGRIRLVATSTAPEVAFEIGSQPVGAPVAVRSGTASTGYPSWGHANGTHTLRAFDCTAYGECSAAGTTATFTIANAASTITAPASGSAVTGLFRVRAANPAGGPLRLLVDGHERARATAGYVFAISGSDISDGPHALTAQGCSVDGRTCNGPVSPALVITARSLHPAITALTAARFSPNGDGVRDSTRLTFRLPDAEAVRVEVLGPAGTVERAPLLGVLGAGAHSWTWHGRDSSGDRLPDGTYRIVVSTSRGALRGWVSRPVTVDTAAPALARPTGANTLFYPYRDGYRDVFTTRTTLGAAGRLSLIVRDAAGDAVRRLSAHHAQGRATMRWWGHFANGARVPAGTYSWQLTLTDAAGNTRRTARYAVRVSSKRLVDETVPVLKAGASYDVAGGTASCAYARNRESVFAGGVRLVNRCQVPDFDLAYAQYTFTVPKALRYKRIAVQVYGRSSHRPSEVAAMFITNDGNLEIPRYQQISRAGDGWHKIASVPANDHITPRRQVQVTVVLDSYYAGPNDFDIGLARLRVSVVVLR